MSQGGGGGVLTEKIRKNNILYTGTTFLINKFIDKKIISTCTYWSLTREVIGTGRWGKSLVLGGGLGLEHLQHIIV